MWFYAHAKEVVKIKAQQLSPDPDKACRGSYVVFASMDLCQKCYDELLAGQMENTWIKRERQHEINAERERRKQREKGK